MHSDRKAQIEKLIAQREEIVNSNIPFRYERAIKSKSITELQNKMEQTRKEIQQLDERITQNYNEYNTKGVELRQLLQEENATG